MSAVIDRIKKLLRLAGNAGSENEAATAARRAAELMHQHQIEEAQVSLDAPETERVAEPIVKHLATDTRKIVAWHGALSNAVAKQYGCHDYYSAGKVCFFGRQSTVQAASYTLQFLIREVERITDDEAPGESRKFRNAFRLGCAHRVAARMIERIAPAATDVEVEIVDEDHAEQVAARQAPASPMALAVVERDREEVQAAYKVMSKGFRTARVGSTSSGDGYRAGKSAGSRVNLGGSARGGLKAGQGSLK